MATITNPNPTIDHQFESDWDNLVAGLDVIGEIFDGDGDYENFLDDEYNDVWEAAMDPNNYIDALNQLPPDRVRNFVRDAQALRGKNGVPGDEDDERQYYGYLLTALQKVDSWLQDHAQAEQQLGAARPAGPGASNIAGSGVGFNGIPQVQQQQGGGGFGTMLTTVGAAAGGGAASAGAASGMTASGAPWTPYAGGGGSPSSGGQQFPAMPGLSGPASGFMPNPAIGGGVGQIQVQGTGASGSAGSLSYAKIRTAAQLLSRRPNPANAIELKSFAMAVKLIDATPLALLRDAVGAHLEPLLLELGGDDGPGY